MNEKKYSNKKRMFVSVLIAAMVILLFLAGIYAIQSRAANNTKKEMTKVVSAKKEEMTQELEEVSEYLTQVRETVSQNHSSLEVILNENFEKQLNETSENILQIDKQLEIYIKRYGSDHAKVTEGLNRIVEQLEISRTQLEDTRNVLLERMLEAEGNAVQRQEKMEEALRDIKERILHIQKQMEDSHKDLIALIEATAADEKLQMDELSNQLNDAKNELDKRSLESENALSEKIDKTEKNLTDELSQTENNLSSQLNRVEKEFSEQNDKMEKNLTDEFSQTGNNLSSQLNQVEKEFSEQNDKMEKSLIDELFQTEKELSEVVSREMEKLTGLLLFENDELKKFMEQKATGLSEKMVSLQRKIEAAQAQVLALSEEMERHEEVRQEEIMDSFTSLFVNLQTIQSDYQALHEELKDLIVELKTLSEENHQELIAVLGQMEEGMEGKSTQNLNKLLETRAQMKEDYGTSITNLQKELNQNLSDMDVNINDQLYQMNTALNQKYDNLTNIVNTGDEGLRSYLENGFGLVGQKLDTVFTYVSDGKKMLASALLTKGVDCRSDATFREIADAILSIPQSIVIGTQQIPGEITYEYHHHKDGHGTLTPSERVSVGARGGCFNTPIYHVHTGDYRNGGGCYTVPVIHNHESSCYQTIRKVRQITGFWFTGQGTGHPCCSSAHGQNYAKFRYVDKVYENGVLISSKEGEGDLGYRCGLCAEREAYSRGSDMTTQNIVCGYSEGINGYELGCGMTTGTVIGYTHGCGFVEGQIIGAHIKYAAGAGNYKTMAAPPLSEGQLHSDVVEDVIKEVIPEEVKQGEEEPSLEEQEEPQVAENELQPEPKKIQYLQEEVIIQDE